MKKIILMMLVLISGISKSNAQQVPKAIVVEYFTNTYCSICAARNPGFYANLKNFPQVLHVSYHPSQPYPSCPLNQHNKTENDAKTIFYGLLNGTPQMAIEGEVISVNEDYGNPLLFSSRLGQTSSFSMNTVLEPVGSDSARITVTVKKMDTSYLTSFNLYGLVAEDTLNFAAHNGETLHQDVFRKSLFGSLPVMVQAPSAIGDSVQFSQTFMLNNVWNRAQCYGLAMISTDDKKIIQAAASERLPQTTTGIVALAGTLNYSVFPVPAGKYLSVKGDFTMALQAKVMDISGKIILVTSLTSQYNTIRLEGIPAGVYSLELRSAKGSQILKFDHIR